MKQGLEIVGKEGEKARCLCADRRSTDQCQTDRRFGSISLRRQSSENQGSDITFTNDHLIRYAVLSLRITV
jgi:hypothetical protein